MTDPILITHNGKTQSITRWAKELKISRHTITGRITKLGGINEETIPKILNPRVLTHSQVAKRAKRASPWRNFRLKGSP